MAHRIVFPARDGNTFGALYDAEAWCEVNGFSNGSAERPNPIGLMFGDYGISKWSNMTKAEQRACHGTIEPLMGNSFRDMDAVVTIRDHAPAEALAAAIKGGAAPVAA